MSNVIVLATYNEAETIHRVLSGLTRYPVVVVDDSSPDGTGQIAARHENVRLISRSGKLGIASAYVCGFHYALQQYKPSFIIQMDAGLTHDPVDVPRLINEAIKTQAGLVIGSRFLIAPHILGYRTPVSLIAARMMNRLGVQVYDATSGFRCWRSTLLGGILGLCPPKATGFAFQLEMLYHAQRLSEKPIAEVSIDYRLSNSTFRWQMLWEALRVYAGLWFDHHERRQQR